MRGSLGEGREKERERERAARGIWIATPNRIFWGRASSVTPIRVPIFHDVYSV